MYFLRTTGRDLFQAEFGAAPAERILMPAETPGRFRTIAAGFAEYSLEERFLKRGEFPLIQTFGGIDRIHRLSDFFGQVFGEDVGGGAHRDGPFDGIFEFPNISRPVICRQQLMGFGTDS